MITSRRMVCVVSALLAVTFLPPADASAQTGYAASIQADLVQSGVPVTSVTVGPPSGQEVELYENPGAPDLTYSVLRVTLTVPRGEPLEGVLPPTDPDALAPTTSVRQVLNWDLAIYEAAKHAIRDGARLTGIATVTNTEGRKPLTNPDVLAAVPDLPPPTVPPTTLTLGEVRQEMTKALPSWALTGDLSVSEDAVGERVVSLRLELAPLFLATGQAENLVNNLRERQIATTLAGGNVGRVTVSIHDPISKDPLFAGADDATYGYFSAWRSPLIPTLATATHAVTGLAKAAQGDVSQAVGPP